MIKLAKYLLVVIMMSIGLSGANMVRNAQIKSIIPPNYRGVCPKNIKIKGLIKTVLPGQLRYRFIYSDGVRSPIQVKNVAWPGDIRVKSIRKFQNSFNGWVRIKVLAPNRFTSAKKNLRVRCQNIQPPIVRAMVSRVRVKTLPINAGVPCPKKIKFKGTIQTRSGGVVKYRFIRSNGTRSPIRKLRVHRAGSYNVYDNFIINRASRGWVKIKIIAPNILLSPKTNFRATCPVIHQPHQPLVQRVKLKASPQEVRAVCPKKMHFKGMIKVRHAGIVKYRFERSDGTKSAIQELRAPRAGNYNITTNWRLRGNTRGWVRLRVISPNRSRMVSGKAHFRLRCLPNMPVIPNIPMRISEFHIEANPGLPEIYRGECPKTIDFTGEFFASRAGIVRYRFIRSNGIVGQTRIIRIDRPGFYSARHSWRIGQTSRGWVRMEILSPVRVRSQRASFSVRCAPVVDIPTNLKVYVDAPVKAYAGDDLTNRVRLIVRNHGRTQALGTRNGNGYKVDLILSKDRASPNRFASYSELYHDDVLLKNGRINRTRTLPAGASQTYLPGAVIPADTPTGSYFLCGRVDPGHMIHESNERDNLSCTPLQIYRHDENRQIIQEDIVEPEKQKDNDHDTINDDLEMELLKRFRPYYKFSRDEKYLPSDALYQLQHAILRKRKIAEGSPSFLHSQPLDCTGATDDPKQILICADQSMDLIQKLQPTIHAIDLNDSLRSDPDSGKSDDWDSAISTSPGLYGHVVKDDTLLKIEYWQFFPYSESSSSGFAHEGDWETMQLWYEQSSDKVVGVCYWAHGAGICFDMNRGKKIYTENGFTYYQGSDINQTLQPIIPKDLESNRYPQAYQNRSISFYTKDNSMHPVIYIEKNNHAFWPSSEGIFKDGDLHNGDGHSYLTTFDDEDKNLGELNATLPDTEHKNSIILQFNGFWGAEHQNLTTPPYGPTQRCQWHYQDNKPELKEGIRKVCRWQ